MGAIRGKENIIYVVRNADARWWKIFDTDIKRKAGSPAIEVYGGDDLSLDASIDQLMNGLDRLTPGRYVFCAMRKKGSTRPDVDIDIEMSDFAQNKTPAISGTAVSGFYMEGIGQVTPENFETAIETKIKKFQEEERKAKELEDLKEKIKTLEAEKSANDNVFRNGILGLGTTLWPMVKKMPEAVEVINVIGGLMGGNASSSRSGTGGTETQQIGNTADNEQQRFESAIEGLSKDNPNVVEEIEMLAKLKANNPDMYAQGLDFIKGMND